MKRHTFIVLVGCLCVLCLVALWSPWNRPAIGWAPVIKTDKEATQAALTFAARLHLPTNGYEMATPATISTFRLKSAKWWRIGWAAKGSSNTTDQLEVQVNEFGWLGLFPYFEGSLNSASIGTNSVYWIDYYNSKRK